MSVSCHGSTDAVDDLLLLSRLPNESTPAWSPAPPPPSFTGQADPGTAGRRARPALSPHRALHSAHDALVPIHGLVARLVPPPHAHRPHRGHRCYECSNPAGAISIRNIRTDQSSRRLQIPPQQQHRARPLPSLPRFLVAPQCGLHTFGDGELPRGDDRPLGGLPIGQFVPAPRDGHFRVGSSLALGLVLPAIGRRLQSTVTPPGPGPSAGRARPGWRCRLVRTRWPREGNGLSIEVAGAGDDPQRALVLRLQQPRRSLPLAGLIRDQHEAAALDHDIGGSEAVAGIVPGEGRGIGREGRRLLLAATRRPASRRRGSGVPRPSC